MAGLLSALGAMTFAPMAWAASGTATVNLTGGSLSVGSVGTDNMSAQIGVTGNGQLPSADWADATGTGDGWNGSVAVSALTYTGQWVAASGSPALGSTSAGTYAGTSDGIWFKVTISSAVFGTSVSYNYTSNYPGDTSGTGAATTVNTTAGTITGSVGNEGLTITFTTTGTYASGDTYTVTAGTQADTMSVDTAVATPVTSTGTTSPAPTYVNNGASISSSGVKVLSAAQYTGMSGSGYYTAAPGVSFTPDSNSWAATYSGNLTYTIASGP